MDFQKNYPLLWLIIVMFVGVPGQTNLCPSPETILPCICANRNEDIQIWCTHSDLPQVIKGVKKIGELIRKPIDELIIENNYLPSLPGKIFQNVKIMRLMLRHNGLERLSSTWLESQESNLVEIFIVEHDLKNLPSESLLKLQNLQAITIQANNLKRIPILTNLPKLRYINIQSENLNSINEHTFENLPRLERLFIQGSPNLRSLKENSFYNLPKLRKLEITYCGINVIHMRALSLLPSLEELSLANNKVADASMIGRATRDLPMLSDLNLSFNSIDKLSEGAFVDQPMLETLYLSNNNINIIHHGAFHRVPKLRIVDLNYNKINRIHPESFLQQSGSGVEELNLIGNRITHISEFRALLDTLPRLKFLDLSENLLREIPRGALRGHPSLERLHLNRNNIKYIQADSFIAMPALRELHLSNNSLSDSMEPPFWNLPELKGLDLSFNYFQRIQPKLPYNLPALRRINLSNNQLTIVDPMTFMESPMLECINISRNALVSIHPATFRNLVNLYEVDASGNKLVELIPGLPRGVEQIFVQQNQITSLPAPPSPDLDLPALRVLDISNNGIQKIPAGGMKTLPNLRRLYMRRNGLRHIDDTTFNDLQNLEILDLSDNQIMSVHPKSFKNLSHLKQVNLHGNTIENFDFVAIQKNSALSIADFSKNKLKTISPNMVNAALDVETLNISSNNLNELPTSLTILPKLKVLDASFNHIRRFDGNLLNNLNTLQDFKMPYNKLTELRTGSFEDLQDLTTINLEGNQIELIHPKAITRLPSLTAIYLGRNHIVDIPDRVFNNLPKLRIIELQGNRIQYISARAFENIPLVQYLNASNNQLTSVENSGLKQLTSLEVLDLSFNKLKTLSRSSFQFMEWLVELNLDNNIICYIQGQPFDSMSRLKVLSLRNNKLTSLAEASFINLRNNIAILDMDGNPLICNCKIMWLKSWLLESSAIGPRCVDGTYVKGMPFGRGDCLKAVINDDEFQSCTGYENEALLPNLASSHILDKAKDHIAQIKDNYNTNKVNSNNRPLPEESEYFYDEYVDYPYNETIVDTINNIIQNSGSKTNSTVNSNPVKNIFQNNVTGNNIKNPVTNNAPNSGFTFFGVPLPPIDMGGLFTTGRKVDDDKRITNAHPTPGTPKFETGGFSPVLPTTAGGFTPILNPSIPEKQNIPIPANPQINSNPSSNTKPNLSNIIKPPTSSNTSVTSGTVKKTKTEIHELEAYLNDDNSTHVAYNRIKNVEEQNGDPKKLSKYNLVESNVTITQITEKEGLLITTDTPSDMSMPGWPETTTMSYPYSNTAKQPMKKIVESQPTALSAILIPSNEELMKRSHSPRPATITKVLLPHIEHFDIQNNFSPVINREGKTRFGDSIHGSTKIRQADTKDWYYKNYNNSNLEPYIAPEIKKSQCSDIPSFKSNLLLFTICFMNMY